MQDRRRSELWFFPSVQEPLFPGKPGDPFIYILSCFSDGPIDFSLRKAECIPQFFIDQDLPVPGDCPNPDSVVPGIRIFRTIASDRGAPSAPATSPADRHAPWPGMARTSGSRTGGSVFKNAPSCLPASWRSKKINLCSRSRGLSMMSPICACSASQGT